MDLVLGPICFGLGCGLPSNEAPYPRNWETRRAYYGGGFGGSVLLMDLDAKMRFAYAMNNMV